MNRVLMSAHLQSDEESTVHAAVGPPVRPRGDVWFLLVLLVLAGLAALLWFGDPSHFSAEKSRVPWPEPKAHKP